MAATTVIQFKVNNFNLHNNVEKMDYDETERYASDLQIRAHRAGMINEVEDLINKVNDPTSIVSQEEIAKLAMFENMKVALQRQLGIKFDEKSDDALISAFAKLGKNKTMNAVRKEFPQMAGMNFGKIKI